jgi:hypothetical protein
MSQRWRPLADLLDTTYEQYPCEPAVVEENDECGVCLRAYGTKDGADDTRPPCQPIALHHTTGLCGHAVGKACWEEHASRSNDRRCIQCRGEIPFERFHLPDDTVYGKALRYITASVWYRKQENYAMRASKALNYFRHPCQDALPLFNGRPVRNSGNLWFERIHVLIFDGINLLGLVAWVELTTVLEKITAREEITALADHWRMQPWFQHLSNDLILWGLTLSILSIRLACDSDTVTACLVLIVYIAAQCIGLWGVLACYLFNWFAFSVVSALVIQRANYRARILGGGVTTAEFNRRALHPVRS